LKKKGSRITASAGVEKNATSGVKTGVEKNGKPGHGKPGKEPWRAGVKKNGIEGDDSLHVGVCPNCGLCPTCGRVALPAPIAAPLWHPWPWAAPLAPQPLLPPMVGPIWRVEIMRDNSAALRELDLRGK
jgi:hypothetical protein